METSRNWVSCYVSHDPIIFGLPSFKVEDEIGRETMVFPVPWESQNPKDQGTQIIKQANEYLQWLKTTVKASKQYPAEWIPDDVTPLLQEGQYIIFPTELPDISGL